MSDTGGAFEAASRDRGAKRDAVSQAAPGLYVIATPIGNLGDITLRAIELLRHVDLLACEDSRVSKRLLSALGIARSVMPYHEHNAAKVRPQLLDALARQQSVGLISDAGTPCLADPGFKLVRAARAAGHAVYSAPGPSAITAALSVCGLATDRFFFDGFLPSRQGERRRRLDALSTIDSTLVMLESPNRLVASLADMAEVLGDRDVAVARELTKRFEEVVRGSLSTIAAEFASRDRVRGEIVIIVDRSIEPVIVERDIDALLEAGLRDEKPARVAARLAKMSPFSRDELYQRALALKRNKTH